VINSRLAKIDNLRGARLRIGRGDTCHLRLEHSSVSREHAEVYRQGPIYALKDCGSTNGTWLNGERVEHTALAPGDVLRVGDCVGVVVKLDLDLPTREFGALGPELFGGPALAKALAKAKASASSDLPLVIVGETGTGKERIARALHHFSGRKGRFNAVNCSTVPAALAEAELFGHQRGAFTGAERTREGHFQAAQDGTLFLDEIADLSLDVQAKLLRAVEQGEVTPLGGTTATPVKVRIMAAAHQRLETLVAERRFRADLYARLAGFVVEVPPLRRRREEIPGFVFQLLEKHCAGERPSVAPALVEWLCLRNWPGNVRELELMVRKLLALYDGEPMLRLSFAQAIVADEPGAAPEPNAARHATAPASGFSDRGASDRYRLRQALERTGGNLKAAAESIGISRRRAYRLLEAEKEGTVASSGDDSTRKETG
jgi:DNA-binding NtrC family response regulator